MTKAEELIKVTSIGKDIEFIKGEVIEIKETLKGNYVTKEEFEPIKKVVYGIIGLILTAVVGAMLGLILTK